MIRHQHLQGVLDPKKILLVLLEKLKVFLEKRKAKKGLSLWVQKITHPDTEEIPFIQSLIALLSINKPTTILDVIKLLNTNPDLLINKPNIAHLLSAFFSIYNKYNYHFANSTTKNLSFTDLYIEQLSVWIKPQFKLLKKNTQPLHKQKISACCTLSAMSWLPEKVKVQLDKILASMVLHLFKRLQQNLNRTVKLFFLTLREIDIKILLPFITKDQLQILIQKLIETFQAKTFDIKFVILVKFLFPILSETNRTSLLTAMLTGMGKGLDHYAINIRDYFFNQFYGYFPSVLEAQQEQFLSIGISTTETDTIHHRLLQFLYIVDLGLLKHSSVLAEWLLTNKNETESTKCVFMKLKILSKIHTSLPVTQQVKIFPILMKALNASTSSNYTQIWEFLMIFSDLIKRNETLILLEKLRGLMDANDSEIVRIAYFYIENLHKQFPNLIPEERKSDIFSLALHHFTIFFGIYRYRSFLFLCQIRTFATQQQERLLIDRFINNLSSLIHCDSQMSLTEIETLIPLSRRAAIIAKIITNLERDELKIYGKRSELLKLITLISWVPVNLRERMINIIDRLHSDKNPIIRSFALIAYYATMPFRAKTTIVLTLDSYPRLNYDVVIELIHCFSSYDHHIPKADREKIMDFIIKQIFNSYTGISEIAFDFFAQHQDWLSTHNKNIYQQEMLNNFSLVNSDNKCNLLRYDVSFSEELKLERLSIHILECFPCIADNVEELNQLNQLISAVPLTFEDKMTLCKKLARLEFSLSRLWNLADSHLLQNLGQPLAILIINNIFNHAASFKKHLPSVCYSLILLMEYMTFRQRLNLFQLILAINRYGYEPVSNEILYHRLVDKYLYTSQFDASLFLITEFFNNVSYNEKVALFSWFANAEKLVDEKINDDDGLLLSQLYNLYRKEVTLPMLRNMLFQQPNELPEELVQEIMVYNFKP